MRLAAQRLVRRTRGAADGRQVLISLTAAGRSLEERAVEVRARVMGGTGLSAAGIDALKLQLPALRAQLSAAEAAA